MVRDALSVVLNDLSDSSKTIFTATQSGSLGDANWPTPDTKFFFTIAASTVLSPALDGHVLQAIGVMSVGVSNPQVETQLSELVVVTQP